MRTAADSAANCSGKLYDFISELPTGTIDGVVGGHVHGMYFFF